MTTWGMSFQKGIIFMSRNYISCAYEEKGQIKEWIAPKKLTSLLKASKLVLLTMPSWFYIFFASWLLLIMMPELFSLKGLPDFSIIYFLFGTHFWFPTELKKYHGAEHKIFSHKGIVSEEELATIRKQKITNNNCSTNVILIFFLTLFLTCILLFVFTTYSLLISLEYATYFSVAISLLFVLYQHRLPMTSWKKQMHRLSYWLQVHVTTMEPDHKHLKIAIASYRLLAEKEFPHRIGKVKEKSVDIFH